VQGLILIKDPSLNLFSDKNRAPEIRKIFSGFQSADKKSGILF
jgi:hypothetical protein